MIREVETFNTEAEAQAEGTRLSGLLYGYGYRFQVYQQGDSWTLDSTRYRSCD
jgi:hypothetical protein